MTTLLVILVVWVLLSIPTALILARMFRSARVDPRRRGTGSDRAELWEIELPAEEFGRDRRPTGL